MKLKILEWNICQGGGQRISLICDRLTNHKADIVILPEFRNNRRGQILRDYLASLDFGFQVSGKAKPQTNTIFLASKLPFEHRTFPDELGEHQHRLVEAQFPAFMLISFYFPQKLEKIALFEFLLELADRYSEKPCILIGDLNTGKHYLDEGGITFKAANYIDKIEKLGYIDAWRNFHGNAREFTWYGRKKDGSTSGFRIDHAFVSKRLLPRTKQAYYSHLEREEHISDHSAMIVRLSLR